MLKTLYAGARRAAGCRARRRQPPRRPQRLPPLRLRRAAPGRSRDNPVDATFLSRTPAQQARLRKGDLARRARPRRHRPRLCGRRLLRHVSGQRSRARRCGDRGARRAGGFSDRRPHAARGADRRRLARRPRPTCCSSCISYITGGERRQKAKALAAGEDPDGDAGDARRAGGDREVPRHPARSGSLHRSARSAAAAALLDRLLAQGRSRPRRAHRRCGALSRSASARGSASPRPSSPTASRPATKLKVYVQKAQHFALPADPVGADHHDRSRHRHRAVPRLPARAHGDQGARPQLAVLRPSAQRLRLLLRGRAHRHEGGAACSRG